MGNPIRYTDPSGHCAVDDEFRKQCSVKQPTALVKFAGVGWTLEEMALVSQGAMTVATAMYEATGGHYGTAGETFSAAYGGAVTFQKRNDKKSNLGDADSKNLIYVNKQTNNYGITHSSNGAMWAAHELGHAFNYALYPNTTDNLGYGQGIIDLAIEGIRTIDGERFTGIPEGSGSYSDYDIYKRSVDKGYQSTSGPYVQNDMPWPTEDHADMFSNWAFDTFTDDVYGDARYDFMESHMAGWVALAVNNNQ